MRCERAQKTNTNSRPRAKTRQEQIKFLVLNTVADYSDSRAIYSKVYWVGLMSCYYALKFMEIHKESLALTSLVECIAIDRYLTNKDRN